MILTTLILTTVILTTVILTTVILTTVPIDHGDIDHGDIDHVDIDHVVIDHSPDWPQLILTTVDIDHSTDWPPSLKIHNDNYTACNTCAFDSIFQILLADMIFIIFWNTEETIETSLFFKLIVHTIKNEIS